VTDIETSGWQLLSATEQNATYPDTFHIPSQQSRRSLKRGDAAKLLFDIETRVNGVVTDRGVDRMWVVILCRTVKGYIGVLDNDPGRAENLALSKGDLIEFDADHVCAIDYPPAEFLATAHARYFPPD
jgi:uncharacterized protein YegJ (DUF2314 family)